MAAEQVDRFVAPLEAILALSTAVLVSVLLPLPFLPRVYDVEFPLRPDVSASVEASDDELIAGVREIAPERRAAVVLSRGESRLVVYGVGDPEELAGPVAGLLARGGFVDVPHTAIPADPTPELLRHRPAVLALSAGAQTAAFLVVGLVLIRLRVRPEPDLPRASWAGALGLGIGGGFVALGLSFAVAALLAVVGLPVQEQEWVREVFSDRDAVLRLAPWMVLLGPLSEEVFFRGYVFRRLWQAAGLPTGVIVSSVLFAFIHFNMSGFLVYLVIGCVMAEVYRRSGHLLAPLAAHVTVNATVLVEGVWMSGNGG